MERGEDVRGLVMSYISAGFLILIAITAIVYYIMPKSCRWVILLAAGVVFYATYGVRYMGYILFTIITTYIFTVQMESAESKTERKRFLIACLLCNFGLLFLMKYLNFTIGNINGLLNLMGVNFTLDKLSLIMPLGMSFYTFQTMSYAIDVYYGKVKPEHNIFKLALFVSFFPQLLQGPIGRFDKLHHQLVEGNDFDITNVEHGLQRMLYGLAKKLVLGDRACIVATTLLTNLDTYTGAHMIAGMLFYSVYIYCDFAGGMDLVIGVAEVFGIRMDENFRQPYFSLSLGEFWRRWHISLGVWMKDYIFYPFSISKPMAKFAKWAKKRFGKQTGRVLPICLANLLIFFIVGVWHGASWKYIIYGLYNGIIIAVSNLLKPLYAKGLKACHINASSWYWKAFSMFRTFVLVNIGWLCDACTSTKEVFKALGNIFIGFDVAKVFDGGLLKMGLNMRDYKVMAVGLVILLFISIAKERGVNIREWLDKRPLVIRWAVYIALVFVTAPFGFVGSTTEFMYAQF